MNRLPIHQYAVAILSFFVVALTDLPAQAQFGGGGGLGYVEMDKKIKRLEQQVQALFDITDNLKKSQLGPDLANGDVTAFGLKHIPADAAAEHLALVLGKELRMSIDKQRNLLLVLSSDEIAKMIQNILQSLDTPSQEEPPQPASASNISAKSLLVHTFWLSDGLREDEGRDPGGFLPDSVLAALKKVGLDAPRIVSQSTSTLISKLESDAAFSSSMSANLNDHMYRMDNQGKLARTDKQQIDIEMETQIYDPNKKGSDCSIRGSLTAPLGHYMVLGTANHVSLLETQSPIDVLKNRNAEEKLKKEQAAKKNVSGEYGRGYGGRGGEYGEYGEYGIQGGRGGYGRVAAPQPKLTTSRFAFVVQVVEGGSYAPGDSER